jgi:hypothetical protein
VALTTDPAAIAPHDHVVQFYDHDDELAGGVIPFLTEALNAGGQLVVMVVELHDMVVGRYCRWICCERHPSSLLNPRPLGTHLHGHVPGPKVLEPWEKPPLSLLSVSLEEWVA